jgi:elongation factor Ts
MTNGDIDMIATSANDIKRLREETSCGVIDCKKALEESNGDFNKAKEFLRKRGLEMAAKKSDRVAKEGRVETYIHNGNKIGVLVEVNCETDFVARSEDFCKFAREVALHIAASNPKYIKKEDVPADILSREADQEAFIKANCLLAQPFVKDPSKSIQDLLNELVAKIGENTVVSHFARFKVGE